jgi:hypothetical protein
MAFSDWLPWRHRTFSKKSEMPFYWVWMTLQLTFAVYFIVLLSENTDKPTALPSMKSLPTVYNLKLSQNAPFIPPAPTDIKFPDDSEKILNVGSQDEPVAPDTCLLARKGMPKEYKATAPYGNRQIVVVNGTFVTEQVCTNATPTDLLGDALGCNASTNGDWAKFLCSPAEHVLALVCPTWTDLSTKSDCQPPIRCCDQKTGFVDGIEYFIEPYFKEGVRQGSLTNKETGAVKTNADASIKFYMMKDIVANTYNNCTYASNDHNFEGMTYECRYD